MLSTAQLRRSGLVWLLVLVAGCATTSRQSAVAQNPNEMIGSWHGWLIKARSFDWINLDIRSDGSFELWGEWGIRSSGILIVRDGAVRFEGSRAWRGTLVLSSGPAGPVLKLEHDNRAERATLHRETRPTNDPRRAAQGRSAVLPDSARIPH
jgi:hypothetical protein